MTLANSVGLVPATRGEKPPVARAQVSARTERRATSAAAALAVVALALNVVMQLVMTPLLLSRWGEAGFALYVALQGLAGYVSVADAGVQVYLSQRLALLRARGDDRQADALSGGGLRGLRWLGLVGVCTVFAVFVATGQRVWSDLASRCGVDPALVLVAALALLVSGGVSLAAGGWSTAVDTSRRRYLRVQVYGLVRAVLVQGSVALPALVREGPTHGLLLLSGTVILFDLLRFSWARQRERHAERPVPLRRLLKDGKGSFALAFASTTQSSLLPYVTATLSSAATTVVVPGRTLANGARTVCNAIGNVVWGPVTVRLADLAAPRSRHAFWDRSALVLSIVQLLGVAALLTLAPAVLPRWLPAQAQAISHLLPWYCAEQGAYAASFPVIVLGNAVGQFGLLAAVTLAAATASVVGAALLVRELGATGVAASGALSAALIAAPSLIVWEWRYWKAQGVDATSTAVWRVVTLVGVVAISAVVRHDPAVGAVLCLALATVVALRVRSLSRGRPPSSGS